MNTFFILKDYLKGKKTYIVAILLVLYAIAGFATGQLTLEQAYLVVLNGLGFGALSARIGGK